METLNTSSDTAEPLTNAADASIGTGSLSEILMGFIDTGGPVVVILLALSVFALTVALVKAIQLWPAIMRPERRLAQAMDVFTSGATADAERQFRSLPGEVAHVCALAVTGVRRKDDNGVLRERIEVAGRGAVARMRTHLRVLEVISQVAPLLGLLGTILGMIEVFRVLEGSGSAVNPAELAGGIWVALLTTATGLGVAIPASIAVQWFDCIIDREAQAIEEGVTAIVTGRPIDSQAGQGDGYGAVGLQPVAGE